MLHFKTGWSKYCDLATDDIRFETGVGTRTSIQVWTGIWGYARIKTSVRIVVWVNFFWIKSVEGNNSIERL